MRLSILFTILVSVIYTVAHCQTITTIAGKNGAGFTGDGGPATAAQLDEPFGVAVDANGNVYIADGINKRVRKITTDGMINTIAGNGSIAFNGDGIPATDAAIDVTNVAVSSSGIVYITDGYNNRLRVVTPDGMITTIAGNGSPSYGGDGGPATDAALNAPVGLTVDAAGNIYIADLLNNRIRKATTDGMITTVAGTGAYSYNGDGEPATAAQLNQPYGVAVDDSGNIYIAEFAAQRIRKVDAGGIISTFAGNGTVGFSGDGTLATTAQLSYPQGVATDNAGNVYVADYGNERLRKIDQNGIITTFAGSGNAGYKGDGGPATAASLNDPVSACIDASGNVFIADRSNNRIREIYPWNVGVKNVNNSTQAAELQIWPHPNNGTFNLYISAPTNETARVIITNPIGQIITQISATTNKSLELSLDIPPGMYLVTAITKYGKQNSKVIVR
jgi:type IX secretion system substrate protein/NHL repeat-containing protein